MLDGLNLSNLKVDDSGRVSFSGLSSGIDLAGTVEAIIAARRIPVDRLEATVESNAEKITSLQELRTILESLRSSLSKLYGQVSFGNNNNIFSAKQAFASSSRVDGATATAAGNLMGVTVDNAATTGNHSVEILQTAKSHKVSSDQVTDPTAAIGFADTDQFTITSNKTRTSFLSSVTTAATDAIGSAGTLEFTDDDGDSIGTIAYLATDTIDDIATAITAGVTGVTATVKTVSGGVRLSIAATDAFRISETGAGTALTDFEIGVKKIGVTSTTTLLDLRDLINQANTGNTATGVNASVVTVTGSESYLVLTAANTGVTMTLADTSGTPLDTIGVLTGANAVGNSLEFSEEMDNAYWTTQAGAIDPNSALAPDGTMTADGVIGDATLTTHPVYTTTPQSVTNGTSYIFSTYAKAGDRDSIALQVNGTGFNPPAPDRYAEFDLVNGVVSANPPPSAGIDSTSIEDIGNGWYRVSIKVTASANGTSIFEFYPTDNAIGWAPAYAGNAITPDTYLWGAQLEEVTVETAPTTYVATSIKINNQLQAARNAQLYADGVLDQTNLNYESDFQTSATVEAGSAGTLSFNAGALGTVAYTSTTTLTALAAAITTNITGVSAEVVTDGAGVRLQITSATAFTITETGGGTAIADLGIDNSRKVIERTSNTIDDLFSGITLSLFAAEAGTTISLDVEQDLSQVKTEIVSFVESYNALRQFVNSHRLIDTATGTLSENAGVLSKSQGLAQVATSLSQILGTGVTGIGDDFTVLSQIGVNFVGLSQEDPLLSENLEIDEALLDSVLLSNPGEVRKLFSFDLTSSDPRITLLGFTGKTLYDSSGYTLNLQPLPGSNQLLYSAQMDNAYWTKQAGTIGTDSAVAPDGSTTADAVIGDATLTSHPVYTATPQSVTAGTSYIFSTYAKAGDRDSLWVQANGAGFGGDHYAEFDLINGVVSANPPPSAGVEATSIEDAGNGWYRVSIKVTATANDTSIFEFYPTDNASASPIYTGDGITANTYLWGGQLEAVTTETSPGAYRVTTDTAITTSAATANINGAAGGFDDGSATVSASVITVNNGTSEGLRLFYSGFLSSASAQLDITVGLGAQMFFKIDKLLDTTTGIVDGEIDEMTDQNTLNNERITEMLDRLEIQRQNLLERYIAMETALASANRVMDSIRQTTDALAKNS